MATKTPLNLAAISEDEFNSEMEKSYKSMKAGKGKPAKKAFVSIKANGNKNRSLTATG